MDAHNLFAYSTLSASASSSVTTVTVSDASAFPDPAGGQYNCVIWPNSTKPVSTNAEVVRVTAKAGSVLTITRAQEGSTAYVFAAGDEIANAITPKVLTDIETAVNSVSAIASAASAEILAHEGDTVDAHDASAVSLLDSASKFAGTEVETALAELGAFMTPELLPQNVQSITGDNTVAANRTLTTEDVVEVASGKIFEVLSGGILSIWSGVQGKAIDIIVADSALKFPASAFNPSSVKNLEAVLNKVGTDVLALSAGLGGLSRIAVDLRQPITASLVGNVFPTNTALTAWENQHWEFVKDVDGKLYGIFKIPSNVTPSAQKIVLECTWNATSLVSRLSVATNRVPDGSSMNPAALAGTATSQDITVPGTARFRKKVSFTIAGETWAADDVVIVQVFHEGAHANDTVAVNTELLGAWAELS